MTEINQKNREIYLNLCKTVWDLDNDSMEYIKKRTSDDWAPVEELKSLLSLPNSKFEDQRVRIDMDMSKSETLSFFKDTDKSYSIFTSTFRNVIAYLSDEYCCDITYENFINNKILFKKNLTKIKKVFEVIYAEKNRLFERDSCEDYTKEKCADWIVKKFEKIGASKKSAKKLQLVISFNPMDWLMSSTSEDWSSCFNINNSNGGYQYCLGLPFLCGDKNRMLLYITDGTKKDCMGITVDHYQTRTWCLLGDDGNLNIVKWYPNDTVGVNPVTSMTGDNRFTNRDSFRRSKYPLDILSTKKGAIIGVYSDMGKLKEIDGKLWIDGNGKDGQQLFSKNLVDCSNISSSIRFGSRSNDLFRVNGFIIPEWKKLGYHVDANFPTYICKSCNEDKIGISLNSKGFLCFDCYKEQAFKCEKCHSQSFKVDGYHEVTTTDNKKIHICSECFENIKSNTCSCCGKYSVTSMHQIEEDGSIGFICNNCLSVGTNGYSVCTNCGSVSKNVVVNYNTFTKYYVNSCKHCSENTNSTISTFGRYNTIIRHKAGGFSE